MKQKCSRYGKSVHYENTVIRKLNVGRSRLFSEAGGFYALSERIRSPRFDVYCIGLT